MNPKPFPRWPTWNSARLVSACGISIALFAGALGWFLLRENYHPVRPGELFRSAQLSAAGIERCVAQDRIRTIINLRGAWPREEWYETERATADRLGVRHFDVCLKTYQQPPIRELQNLVRILDTAPRPILVHCRWGADRTSLAVAIDEVLHGGKTPDEAMSAYRLEYGHTGWSWGHHLTHIFAYYQDTLAQTGQVHSPEAFRQWVASQDHLGYFAADLEAKPLPQLHPVGRPLRLTMRVVNDSDQIWMMRDPAERGIHVFLETKDLTTGFRRRHATRQPVGSIHPGQSFQVEFEIAPFSRPGNYRVRADLEDGHGLRFSEMGKGCWCQDIRVSDSATALALIESHTP